MTAVGRLLSNREVRLLTEIKKKVSTNIQAAIMVATRYMRNTVWAKRKVCRPATACTLRRKWPTAMNS